MSMLSFVPKYFYALGCGVRLFSVGVFNKNERGLVWEICRRYGWPVIRRQVPEVSPDIFLDGEISVQLQATDTQDGNCSVHELAILCAAARCSVGDIFEIGTFDGRTTLNLFYNLKNKQATVYTLDLPLEQIDNIKLSVEQNDIPYIDKPESGRRFKSLNETEIKQLYGDSATFDFTPYLGKMGLVFVDGSHAYEYVKSDAQHAVKLIGKEGGNIFFHDYDATWPGVVKALNELYRDNPRFSGLRHIKGTSLAWLPVSA